MAEIGVMQLEDLPAVGALWAVSEGLTLRDTDSPEALRRYLLRNPGLSLVAREQGQIIGAVLCGHDGRRGYLHHLAVAPEYRRAGIGRALAEHCLAGLAEIGLLKCHLFVRVENEAAQRFWSSLGWVEREDILTMSRNQSAAENA